MAEYVGFAFAVWCENPTTGAKFQGEPDLLMGLTSDQLNMVKNSTATFEFSDPEIERSRQVRYVSGGAVGIVSYLNGTKFSDGLLPFPDFIPLWKPSYLTIFVATKEELSTVRSGTLTTVKAFEEIAVLPPLATITYVSEYSQPEPRTVEMDYDPIYILRDDDLPQLENDFYTLDGWYREPELINKAEDGNMISDDITLYAKWTEKEYPNKVVQPRKLIDGSMYNLMYQTTASAVKCADGKTVEEKLAMDYAVNDPAAAGYIANRPCYAEAETISWDGSTEGLVSTTTSDGLTLVRLSELAPTADELVGQKITMTMNAQLRSITITADRVAEGENCRMIGQIGDGIDTETVPFLFVADKAGDASVLFYSMTFPSAGVYGIVEVMALMKCTAASMPVEAIHKLDAKFIPPGVRNKPGKSMAGQTVKPTADTEVVAEKGAEVFNDCSERTYNEGGGISSGNVASGEYSHAEGHLTTASNYCSHAEGAATTASGWVSHAEGWWTIASNESSHAEGYGAKASGYCSHAEGHLTTASGKYSHAEGNHTTAAGQAQHVQGSYNVEDALGKYAHIVGNGKGDTKRSNAHTLDWSGNAWYAGRVSAGTAEAPANPTEANDLTTKQYVDTAIANAIGTALARSY